MSTRRRLGWSMAFLGAALLVVAIAQATAYWPGIMTWDAVRQYDQALSGEFDDWHPPAMEWLWRQLVPIHDGPGPMLLVQLGLYWGGYALLAARAWCTQRRGLATALAACALLPLAMALMGAVLKDCLMTGALLSATGLLAWSGAERRWRTAVPGVLLLLCASTLRFNAFLACLPLLVALLPLGWRDRPRRLALSVAIATAALVAAMPVANRLVGATKSGVELSLIIFDLGGITYHSGIDAFPSQPVADPVAINQGCYSPVKWDPYSWWVEAPCKIGFESVGRAFKASGVSPYRFWINAIVHHPIAYATHRLAHFNINSRFLVHDEVERPVTDQSAPNDWNYRITPGPIQRLIDGAALLSAHSPLGWPIWWMAVALGTLALAPRLPSRRIIAPVALSALLYGLGYIVFSVAAELRYHLWTIAGTAIAAALAASDIANGAPVARSRLVLAAAPAILVAALCAAWRLFPGL